MLSDTKQLGKDHAPAGAHGEPIFVLRGQDKFAASLVKLWAELNSLNPECPPEKVKSARQIAWAMERWPTKKWPD